MQPAWVRETSQAGTQNSGEHTAREPKNIMGRWAYPALNASTLSLSPEGKALMASRDINVVALVKGSERYVFLYDDDSRTETLRTLNRYAADPKLSFSWYDASVLGQKVRQNKTHSRREGIAPRVDRRTS